MPKSEGQRFQCQSSISLKFIWKAEGKNYRRSKRRRWWASVFKFLGLLWPAWPWAGGGIPLCTLGLKGRVGTNWQNPKLASEPADAIAAQSLCHIGDREQEARSGELVTQVYLARGWRLAKWKEADVKPGRPSHQKWRQIWGRNHDKQGLKAEVEATPSPEENMVKSRTQDIIGSGCAW